MATVKAFLVNMYQVMVSDTLASEKGFDENTSRVARGFTNFG